VHAGVERIGEAEVSRRYEAGTFLAGVAGVDVRSGPKATARKATNHLPTRSPSTLKWLRCLRRAPRVGVPRSSAHGHREDRPPRQCGPRGRRLPRVGQPVGCLRPRTRPLPRRRAPSNVAKPRLYDAPARPAWRPRDPLRLGPASSATRSRSSMVSARSCEWCGVNAGAWTVSRVVKPALLAVPRCTGEWPAGRAEHHLPWRAPRGRKKLASATSDGARAGDQRDGLQFESAVKIYESPRLRISISARTANSGRRRSCR
jgi:hypothetical protein